MYQILLVIHVLLTLALIVTILLQRSTTDGFGMGSGSGSNLMTGRASANLLTRATAIIAALFIANSLVLGILSQSGKTSIADEVMQIENKSGATEVVPAADPAEAGNAGDAAEDVPADGKAPEAEDISVPRPGME